MPGLDDGEADSTEQVGTAPGPQTATSPPEFVAAMRALKQWSGLTYRQLQRRAEAARDVLPHSTTAAVLGRATLPRENVIAAFVRACGGDEATVAVWLTARKRIAVGTAQPAAAVTPVATPPASDEPAETPERPETREPSLAETPEPSRAEASESPSMEPPKRSLPGQPPTPFDPGAGSRLGSEPVRDDLDPLTAAWTDLVNPGSSTPISDQSPGDTNLDRPDVASPSPDTAATVVAATPTAAADADMAARDSSGAERDGSGPEGSGRDGSQRDGSDTRAAVPVFSDGKLASTVAKQKGEQWVGLHRYDPAVEVPRPAGLRWLIPPIMYRTGWSTRVLSGVLVLILALITVGVTARFLRDDGADPTGDPGVAIGSTVDPELDLEIPEPIETPSAKPTKSASTKPRPSTNAPTSPRPALPPEGQVLIKLAHSGLCIGEGPELYKNSRRIVLGQHPCATAAPPTILERVGGNTYRIKTDNPQYGIGCATIDGGGTIDGVLIAATTCDNNRADQKFVIERVTAPAVGYRIRSAASGSGNCIGALHATRDSGAQIIQIRCEGGRHEVFTFTRR